MASIRFRNGRFEARVRIAGQSFSKSFDANDDAKKWALGLEMGVMQPPARRGQPSPLMTFSEAADRYLKEVAVRHKGFKQESERVRQLKRLGWAGAAIKEVSIENVRTLRDEMTNRGLSPSTVRLMLSLVSSIFRNARIEWGLTINNPVEGIRLPAPAAARYRRLTPEEEERLMKSLDQCKNRWMRAIAEFALETGMRRSELLALEWSALDVGGRFLTLSETKNGSRRWVPLTPKALGILKVQKNQELPKPFPVSATLLEQAWGHAVRRAKIQDLHWHDLRHESLSRWAHRLNGDIFKLASISGHRTISMLHRYVNPLQAEVLSSVV